jgi:hypothetical protein
MESEPSSFNVSEQEQNVPTDQKVKKQFVSTKQATSNVAQDVSEQAAATLESAKANLREAARGATEYGKGLFNEQKRKLAQAIDDYCHAADLISGKLRQDGHTALASRADVLASRIRRLTAYLRDRELSDIYRDAEQFTRRRPEVVFGILFSAGLMTARLLKASDPNRTTSRRPQAEGGRNLPEDPAQTATVWPVRGESS